MPARSQNSKWALGAHDWGKMLGEDTLWVVLACKEAVLVQMFSSYHIHAAEAWTSSLGRVRLLHRNNSAERCQRSTCHSLSSRLITTLLFYSHRGKETKMQTVNPGKRKCDWNVFFLISLLTLEQELIAANNSATQSNDLLEMVSAPVKVRVWEEDAQR